MPDTPSAWELHRRIEAQEHACERRAAGHVDRELYTSERRQFRTELNALQSRVDKLDAEKDAVRDEAITAVEGLRNRIAAERKWAIGTIIALLAIGVPVLVQVLT